MLSVKLQHTKFLQLNSLTPEFHSHETTNIILNSNSRVECQHKKKKKFPLAAFPVRLLNQTCQMGEVSIAFLCSSRKRSKF